MATCTEGCSHNHEHDEFEEDDPCMAEHIRVVEKGRRLAEKLRIQEDKIIGARRVIAESIRSAIKESDFSRFAISTDHQCSDDCTEHVRKNLCLDISIDDAVGFLSTGCKTYLLVFPCDIPIHTDLEVIHDAFNDVAQLSAIGACRYLRIRERFCVCGRCEISRPSGILRSMTLILRRTASVIYSAGFGISGFLTFNSSDYDSLHSDLVTFISKH